MLSRTNKCNSWLAGSFFNNSLLIQISTYSDHTGKIFLPRIKVRLIDINSISSQVHFDINYKYHNLCIK